MTRRQFLLAGAGAGLGTASCRGQSVASLAATDSGAELAYWQDQAALIDPAAYVWTHGAGFSLNVPAGKRWYARNLSAIKARLLAHVVANAPAMPPSETTIIVKEPNGSEAADLILGALPHAGVLFLLRDGRDVVDSWAFASGSTKARGRRTPG